MCKEVAARTVETSSPYTGPPRPSHENDRTHHSQHSGAGFQRLSTDPFINLADSPTRTTPIEQFSFLLSSSFTHSANPSTRKSTLALQHRIHQFTVIYLSLLHHPKDPSPSHKWVQAPFSAANKHEPVSPPSCRLKDTRRRQAFK